MMRVSQAHTMPASSYVASCPNEPTELLLSLHLCRTPQRNATPDQRSPLALPLLSHSLPLKPWILYGSPLPYSLPPLSLCRANFSTLLTFSQRWKRRPSAGWPALEKTGKPGNRTFDESLDITVFASIPAFLLFPCFFRCFLRFFAFVFFFFLE